MSRKASDDDARSIEHRLGLQAQALRFAALNCDRASAEPLEHRNRLQPGAVSRRLHQYDLAATPQVRYHGITEPSSFGALPLLSSASESMTSSMPVTLSCAPPPRPGKPDWRSVLSY